MICRYSQPCDSRLWNGELEAGFAFTKVQAYANGTVVPGHTGSSTRTALRGRKTSFTPRIMAARDRQVERKSAEMAAASATAARGNRWKEMCMEVRLHM